MSYKQTSLDWAISIIALTVIFGLMGTLDAEEQAIAADVVVEAKIAAKADMLTRKSEMAAIDARARYMTGYELIEIAEAHHD